MNIAVHNFIDVDESRKRRLQAMAMQEIEGNPLTKEEIEMFEMFEDKGWSHERRHAHILLQFRVQSAE